MMHQQFMFVEGAHADGPSKRLMRRHVMRGKNLGKKVQRPSRKMLPHKRKSITVSMSDRTATITGRALWPFTPGVVVKPDALRIVQTFFFNVSDRVYPAKLGLSMDQIKIAWFQHLCTDVDAQNCCVAVIQACNELFLGLTPTSQAVYSLSYTLRVVNKRIRGQDALSNSTIAIVLSLIGHEQIRNERASAMVHTRGLGSMVQLRGGLDRLDTAENLVLVLKICKTDLSFALQYGSAPMFFRDKFSAVQGRLAAKGLDLHGGAACPLPQHDQVDTHLGGILRDVIATCTLLNARRGSHTMDCLEYLEIVVSLLYRLLRFRGLNDTKTSTSSATRAYHVGAIILVALMLMQRGPRQVIACQPISQSVRTLPNQPDLDPRVRFWALFMGGVWEGKETSLAGQIANVATDLGLKSWSDARACLGRFAWLAALHDEPGQELWAKIEEAV